MTELHAVSTDASHESPWPTLRLEAAAAAAEEPVLSGFMNASVLNHRTLGAALAYTLARKLGDGDLNALQARTVFEEALAIQPRGRGTACPTSHARFHSHGASCRGTPGRLHKGRGDRLQTTGHSLSPASQRAACEAVVTSRRGGRRRRPCAAGGGARARQGRAKPPRTTEAEKQRTDT